MISLEISTPEMQLPISKAYQPTTTIGELKSKLELIVGGAPQTMKLYSADQLIAQLVGDDKVIQDFIPSDCTGPFKLVAELSAADKKALQDNSVEKFELTDEQYDSKEGTVRKFLLDKKKESVGGGDGGPISVDIPVNSRCEIQVAGKPRRRGVVRFVGETKFKPGVWVGVELDEPTGNNDGSVGGNTYFNCKEKYGSFVRPKDVVCGDFPVEGQEELDEL